MAGLKIHPENPEVRARVDAFYQDQADRRLAAQVASNRAVFEWVKRNRWSIPLALAGGFSWLVTACTRSASGGVIPTEGSPTLEPSHTPTGTEAPTAAHTHTATHTATWSATPPPPTEHLVAPPTASPTDLFVDDGVPDFPDIDPKDDGVDPTEIVAGVATVSEWVNDSLRVLADGKSVSPMIEKLAHLFGFDQEGIRAELAAAPDQPPIDFPWIADTDVGKTDITTVAEHLYSGNGVGILTTGEGLDNMLKTLAPHIRIAGQLLDDPDSAVMSLADLRLSLENSLGVDSDPRAGIQPSPLGELGRNGDLCLNVTFGEGSGQNQSSLNIPVVVDAEVQPGSEFMDSTQKIRVSTKSAIGLALGVVNNSELAALQRFLRDHGDVAIVTKLSLNYSLVTEAFLLENNPEIEGSQLLSCGRPAQSGAQPAATPNPSATPTATETPRPQGGPGPGSGPEQPTNTPVVPSATPRPFPTPETPLPPTNTAVGPTETQGFTPTVTSPLPTIETPSTPSSTSTTPPRETPRATVVPPTDLPITTTPLR